MIRFQLGSDKALKILELSKERLDEKIKLLEKEQNVH